MISTAIVIVFAVTLTLLVGARFGPRDQRALVLGLAFHILAAFAQILITEHYYGYGDMLVYYRTGAFLADIMRSDFARYVGDVWDLLLQRPNSLPVLGSGRTTGSMHAISGFLCLLVGNSLWAVCVTASIIAFAGHGAIYVALRAAFADSMARRLAWVTLYFPSGIFWTSGLLKETIATAGLGWIFWSFVQTLVLRRARISAIGAGLAGAGAVGITKPYVLFAFAVAACVALFGISAFRSRKRFRLLDRPGRLAIVISAAVVVVGMLGSLFPEYAVDNVANEALGMRASGILHPGGSTYVSEGEDNIERGLMGNLLFAPVGLLSSLARPVIFEVQNPMMLAAALETSVLLFWVWRVFRRVRLRQALNTIGGHPLLLFSVVFVLVFGTGVGIATVNLGSLVRYRAPMLAFYGLIVAALLPLPTRKKSNIHASQ